MTKKDLLILVIKLFGLSTAVSVLLAIVPTTLTYSFDQLYTYYMIMIALFSCALCWFLIFHADHLVNLLSLDKGFDEDRIEFGNVKPVDIIRIAVLIIGGVMFVSSFPKLISQAYWLLREDNIGNEISLDSKVSVSVQVLNLLVGYLLFTNYDVVANYFDRKENNSK